MEINELLEYLLSPVAQIALIIGLAELVKRLGLDRKFIPIFDVVLGLLSGILFYGVFLHVGVVKGLLVGIFLGLSACGLFSGTKNFIEGVREND